MRTERLKILLIVPPERTDFYNYLSQIAEADLFILWFVHKKEGSNIQLPAFIKGLFYWEDYRTPEKLIKSIQPSRIIFFEIIDQRQIALIVTANKLGVSNYYLEHGAAGDKESAIARNDDHSLKYFLQRLPGMASRIIKSIPDVWQVKLFYYSTAKNISKENRFKFLKLPFLTLIYKPNKALMLCKFPERVPGKSILFNQVNFEEYKNYTGANEKQCVMEGVPFFDRFYSYATISSGPIVYIDHPYLEENICGWTNEHHRKIAMALARFTYEKGEKLVIKLHPRSAKALWASYGITSENIKIVQEGDFTETYLKSKLILGYASSLINGFLCAQKNVVLLGWHPTPHIFGSDFSRTGLCHTSFNPEDLFSKIQDWIIHNKTIDNKQAYYDFLKNYNFPFDGKATERVLNTILGYNEVAEQGIPDNIGK